MFSHAQESCLLPQITSIAHKIDCGQVSEFNDYLYLVISTLYVLNLHYDQRISLIEGQNARYSIEII